MPIPRSNSLACLFFRHFSVTPIPSKSDRFLTGQIRLKSLRAKTLRLFHPEISDRSALIREALRSAALVCNFQLTWQTLDHFSEIPQIQRIAVPARSKMEKYR